MNAPRVSAAWVLVFIVLAASTAFFATQAADTTPRISRLILNDPSLSVPVQSLPVELLPPEDPLRAAWKAFVAEHGSGWRVYLDGRSAAPLWVEGRGIPWIAGSGNSLREATPVTLESLEKSLRSFMAGRPLLFKAEDAELVLDREASGNPTPELWQIVFKRQIGAVLVAGDRYLFYIGHGNLIGFGATRWTPIAETMMPVVSLSEALAILRQYMGVGAAEKVSVLDSGNLVLLPMAADMAPRRPYQGAPGKGYIVALAWRQVVQVEGTAGTWVGLVDARSGKILGFYDDDKDATVKGGVYPESTDGICPGGCEQAGYPMPFANITIGHKRLTANSMGIFQCAPPGGLATVTLSGSYVDLTDACGPVSESVTCENDLDFGVSPGTDCTVPLGASAGDTHAARTTFYHLNRAAEKARWYLPTVSWLTRQFDCEVNITDVCGTHYSGFYDHAKYARSGGICGNAGEIPGIVRHEWGHGLDYHDGGDLDNPYEGYADVVEFLDDHTSCIGPGYWPGQQCPSFGNPCLDCTGVRDVDWDKRAAHIPSTPMIIGSCPAGSGPCGGQAHCEGYLVGETLWDLATRDLPAAGLDEASAWQLVQKLWYTSRLGSGGNAYNCALPNSDGCGAGSLFNRLRVFDDDDGTLGNGTPHAAAIYQAFSRHVIACGEAADPSNQSTTICPSITTPVLAVNGESGSISVSWTAVPNAASYRVLRNDFGCSYSFTPVADLPGTSYTDTGLAGLTYYYRIQAVGSNSACDGPVSGCQAAQVACVDADGDGFGSPGSPSCSGGSRLDCDAASVAVYPGALQICDGVNNDCSDPAWPAVPGDEADGDGDGHRICGGDCNDANLAVWAVPGEAENLFWSGDGQGLTWSPPAEPGGTTILYDTIRSSLPSDFMASAACIETDDGSDLTASDPESPPIGQSFFYIIRGENSCGEGSLGEMSGGEQRTARSCP